MTQSNDNILRHFSQCPLCDKSYKGTRVSLVEQRGSRTSFHVTCPSCHTSMMLFTMKGQMGTICVGAVTDIERSELYKLNEQRISPNAVLDLYSDLARSHQSFASLLAEKKASLNVIK